INKPSKLCNITTENINKPVVAISSVFKATTAAATATIPTTDTSGKAFTLLSTCLVKTIRIMIPSTIGINTICTMEKNISPAETGSHLLAKINVKKGVKIGASIVDTAVIVTDKAVFPFAKNVITLEAVPPGQQPTKIT